MSVRYRVLPVVLAAVLLAGCRSATFNGSRTGNDSQLIMEYTVFNTTDSQTLELERGGSAVGGDCPGKGDPFSLH